MITFDQTYDVLGLQSKKDLFDYLTMVDGVKHIDIEHTYKIALASIRYYNGDHAMREHLQAGQELERQWYESLEQGKPDYSVYDNEFYVADLWACWIVYSRKYLKAMENSKNMRQGVSISAQLRNAECVVDLGNGFGYTSAALKQMFPWAKVYGTNLEDTFQYQVSSLVGKQYNFQVVPSSTMVPQNADLVFASEYFEHIERPVEHLNDVIQEIEPKAFIIANAFGAISIGHFHLYYHGQKTIPGDKISRLFNQCLRDHGYKKIETKLWNNRPSYWRRP